MPTVNRREGRVIRADDPDLTWEGAVEVEHAVNWSRAWRLPKSRIGLFPGKRLSARAVMPAGVRIAFGTDSTTVGGRFVPAGDYELAPIDLVVDGRFVGSHRLVDDHTFSFDSLPQGEKLIELWLPQFGEVRLATLTVDAESKIWRRVAADRPRLVAYGSSITQCRTAGSPTRTWPALVAHELGLDLTCLGFGGECHLDPMIARLIRDLPAELIVTCLGINIYERGTFTERSFIPAVLGFLSTIRDGHPGCPIAVMSPIVSPSREDAVGPTGLTLASVREQVGQAVRLLWRYGDPDLYLFDGMHVLGYDDGERLHDGLHPDAEGYELMARALIPRMRRMIAP